MPRKVLFFTALTIFTTLYAQGQSSTQPVTQPAANAAPFGGPLLTTPTAGISDAERAGISLTENNSSNPAAAPTPAATTTSTETVAAPPALVPAAPQLPPATPAEGQRAADLGPSVYVGDQSDSTANVPMSVAEVAKRYQMEQGAQNAHRTLTNEDVKQMLKKKSAISVPQNSQPNQSQ